MTLCNTNVVIQITWWTQIQLELLRQFVEVVEVKR